MPNLKRICDDYAFEETPLKHFSTTSKVAGND